MSRTSSVLTFESLRSAGKFVQQTKEAPADSLEYWMMGEKNIKQTDIVTWLSFGKLPRSWPPRDLERLLIAVHCRLDASPPPRGLARHAVRDGIIHDEGSVLAFPSLARRSRDHRLPGSRSASSAPTRRSTLRVARTRRVFQLLTSAVEIFEWLAWT